MSCTLGLPEGNWRSSVEVEAQTVPGVQFAVRRMSLGRRNELIRRVRELSRQAEFHAAGDSTEDRLQAAAMALEIESTYIRWGLIWMEGLTIDGAPATTDLLISDGPEGLAREIAAAVKAQCALSESERKN
ncbi:MAG TPA: hypothetical protein VFA04_24355 [Bryobacteraceae bacterium]|nr:hypothetical protein [Bryobacteraceae bacterium]